jgi:hypothetical protein
MNLEIAPKEYERKSYWEDANLYCQLLTIDNKNDWRLPSTAELEYINKIRFYIEDFDFVGNEYWSCDCSLYIGNGSKTYIFGDTKWLEGLATINYFNANDVYVRPVRTV